MNKVGTKQNQVAPDRNQPGTQQEQLIKTWYHNKVEIDNHIKAETRTGGIE